MHGQGMDMIMMTQSRGPLFRRAFIDMRTPRLLWLARGVHELRSSPRSLSLL